MRVLEWLFANYPTSEPDSKEWWGSLAERNLHKPYRWLLEKYPKVRKPEELAEDARKAFVNGSLELLKVLYENHPSALCSLYNEDVTSKTYHIHQWLALIDIQSSDAN
jgi:hypothetical protein